MVNAFHGSRVVDKAYFRVAPGTIFGLLTLSTALIMRWAGAIFRTTILLWWEESNLEGNCALGRSAVEPGRSGNPGAE